MLKLILFYLFSFIFCLLSSAFGGLIHVPQNQPGIQLGINAAVNGDTVLVADSTYYENINFMGKAITVASNYIMDQDTNHINSTIINGSQLSHPDSGSVVSFVSGEDTSSILIGFTITQGSGTETSYWWSGTQYFCRSGGGIFCHDSGARIVKNKIIENTVNSPDKGTSGGGFDAPFWGSAAYIILEENQILHNTVSAAVEDGGWGGGVDIVCNGRLVNNIISFNTVIHNAPTYHSGAGGLCCFSDAGHLRNLIVESNKINHNSVISYSNETGVPNAFGGGVLIMGIEGRFKKNEVSHNEIWINSEKNGCGAGIAIQEVPESLKIEGNIICENAVINGKGWGGGFNIASNAFPTLINNIIDGNSATNGSGGGILITENCTVKFINNTIINNQATTGGGMYLGNTPSTNYLMNTIIWGNQATTNPAIHIVAGTIDVAYCDVQGGWPGTGNISKEPMLRGDSLMLSDSSSCIGAGTLSYQFGSTTITCPDTCFLGNPRPSPLGSNPDIGACESLRDSPVVGIANPLSANIPKSYELKQNYPNPFNPITTIEFALPYSGFVELKIYNILGEEVTTLVSASLLSGSYVYEWDASGMASGVYLYRLQAGDGFVQTKKMLLVR
jgi:hypothetical protein